MDRSNVSGHESDSSTTIMGDTIPQASRNNLKRSPTGGGGGAATATATNPRKRRRVNFSYAPNGLPRAFSPDLPQHQDLSDSEQDEYVPAEPPHNKGNFRFRADSGASSPRYMPRSPVMSGPEMVVVDDEFVSGSESSASPTPSRPSCFFQFSPMDGDISESQQLQQLQLQHQLQLQNDDYDDYDDYDDDDDDDDDNDDDDDPDLAQWSSLYSSSPPPRPPPAKISSTTTINKEEEIFRLATSSAAKKYVEEEEEEEEEDGTTKPGQRYSNGNIIRNMMNSTEFLERHDHVVDPVRISEIGIDGTGRLFLPLSRVGDDSDAVTEKTTDFRRAFTEAAGIIREGKRVFSVCRSRDLRLLVNSYGSQFEGGDGDGGSIFWGVVAEFGTYPSGPLTVRKLAEALMASREEEDELKGIMSNLSVAKQDLLETGSISVKRWEKLRRVRHHPWNEWWNKYLLLGGGGEVEELVAEHLEPILDDVIARLGLVSSIGNAVERALDELRGSYR
ncbi:hypothetical protein QBC44DRAFT_38909 [Cladorrhinum sp. PSN332]|nr:hypothetical protein QBC44DRAFT_38909 [Cladorrhinum sp. PSN332]